MAIIDSTVAARCDKVCGLCVKQFFTKWFGVAVIVLTHIWEVLCLNLNWDVGYPDRTHIWEVHCLNLSWDVGYPDRFLWFSSVPPSKCRTHIWGVHCLNLNWDVGYPDRTHIWEVHCLNLNWDVGYPDRFLWFSSVPPSKCWDSSSIRS
jgi:hypothetical protein